MANADGGFRDNKARAVRPGAPGAGSRLRLRFARGEAARLISQHGQIAAFRAIAENAGLNCAVKSGKVKMSFGPAIVEGYESLAEYADLFLTGYVDSGLAAEKIRSSAAAQNYELLGAKRVPLQFPSLEELICAVRYTVYGDFSSARESLADYVERGIVRRERSEGRVDELVAREIVRASAAEEGKLELLMNIGPGRNLKPELLISGWLGKECLPVRELKVVREDFYWESRNGLLSVWE
ncbi:MAG: DUF2344 domain-containing protein [Elusimicrobiaceae bacterium]